MVQTKGDVLQYRSSEKPRILRHYTEQGAQPLGIQLAQRHAVQPHLARVRLIPPLQQSSNGRLATARCPHDRRRGSGLQLQVEVPQHRLAWACGVSEGDVIKCHLHPQLGREDRAQRGGALGPRRRHDAGRRRHLRVLEDVARRAYRLHQLAVLAADGQRGAHHGVHVQHRGCELLGGDPPARDQCAACSQCHCLDPLCETVVEGGVEPVGCGPLVL
mmetsp:Transcript_81977/g.244513  ORF Transcript_81977/g.244513 Transcript_81977/m.244513 type:complete len:217 (+) Transcript_81977:470-1120(+)